MSGIEDLQGRLARALERIGQATEAWDPAALRAAEAALAEARAAPPPEPKADPAELKRLRAALEDEKLANEQLEQRIRQLRARLDEAAPDAGLADRLEAQREGMAQLDADLQRMRRTNDMLARTSDALRAANSQNLGDAQLINQAMLAELEALRAARAAEATELRLIRETLAPLTGEDA